MYRKNHTLYDKRHLSDIGSGVKNYRLFINAPDLSLTRSNSRIDLYYRNFSVSRLVCQPNTQDSFANLLTKITIDIRKTIL